VKIGQKTLAGIEAQRAIGFDRIAIDFDHCTVSTTQAYKDLLGVGHPPLIFGYGRPNVVPDDGLYVDQVVWTPLGIQHAKNFEDLSPAVNDRDKDGEVTFLHSVALTPNGKVTDLHFFSADPYNAPKHMNVPIDMARIFNLENYINDRRESHLRLMSSEGGSNDHDADYSERLKLLRDAIRRGKPRPLLAIPGQYRPSKKLRRGGDSVKEGFRRCQMFLLNSL
jgi:hypothetical protein